MNEIELMLASIEADTAAYARGETPGPACSCGTGRIEEYTVVETIPYGGKGKTYDVEVPVVRCLDCNMAFTDYRAENLRHVALCRHLGVLPPEEVKAVRDSLKMSRREFDEAYGIPPASMDRWENGRLMQNRSMDTLLRALSNPVTAKRLDRRQPREDPVVFRDNVIQGNFGALAAKTEAEQADVIRRRDRFKLRANG